MALGQDQKDFIKNKVIELGSIEAVKEFYCSNSNVAKFAIKLAKDMYKPTRKRLRMRKE